MQKRILGKELEVSAIGLGCMGMSEFYGPRDDKESLMILNRAVDMGCCLFDTADTYGNHHNEKLLAQIIRKRNPNIKIATKFGIVRRPGEYQRRIDNSSQYIRKACEDSLRRLGVECIDLYYVHRLDPNALIETTMQTLSELVAEGKSPILDYLKSATRLLEERIPSIRLPLFRLNIHCGLAMWKQKYCQLVAS